MRTVIAFLFMCSSAFAQPSSLDRVASALENIDSRQLIDRMEAAGRNQAAESAMEMNIAQLQQMVIALNAQNAALAKQNAALVKQNAGLQANAKKVANKKPFAAPPGIPSREVFLAMPEDKYLDALREKILLGLMAIEKGDGSRLAEAVHYFYGKEEKRPNIRIYLD